MWLSDMPSASNLPATGGRGSGTTISVMERGYYLRVLLPTCFAMPVREPHSLYNAHVYIYHHFTNIVSATVILPIEILGLPFTLLFSQTY